VERLRTFLQKRGTPTNRRHQPVCDR
jgi:hypothetical protein